MDNLLDTHSFIWFIEGNKQLSAVARKAIEHAGVVNYISIASLWEIAIKIRLGKLELKSNFLKVGKLIESNGFRVLPITFQDTQQLLDLPFHHRDPFDRIIISQAISNKLNIVTKDSNFSAYTVSLVW